MILYFRRPDCVRARRVLVRRALRARRVRVRRPRRLRAPRGRGRRAVRPRRVRAWVPIHPPTRAVWDHVATITKEGRRLMEVFIVKFPCDQAAISWTAARGAASRPPRAAGARCRCATSPPAATSSLWRDCPVLITNDWSLKIEAKRLEFQRRLNMIRFFYRGSE